MEKSAKKATESIEAASKKSEQQTKKSTKAKKEEADATKKQAQETEKETKAKKSNTDTAKKQNQETEKGTKAKKNNTDTTKKNTEETKKNTDGKKKHTDTTKKNTDETDKNTDSTKKNGDAAKEATAKLNSLKVAAAAVGSAMIAAGMASLKEIAETGAEFTSSMSKVQAVSGASGKELEQLTQKAKDMGASTVFSASQAAEAMNYMAMAGWKTSDMLSGIDGIMNLAAASGEDLATTSDIVTDALTAFGMTASDAGHFSDVLAVASSNANTNVSMMGETFKYVGPMAGTLGYSIEDVSTAVGLMANASIKGSMAGTALNAILTRLSTNSNGAADALSELGISFFDSEGNARALGTVMQELREATSGMNQEQKTQLANTVAGMEASKGFLAILNATTADFDKLTDAVHNADGAAQQMADTMVDNLQGDLTLAGSALESLKLAAYDCIEEPFRSAAQNATQALNRLTDSARDGRLKESLEDVGRSAGQIMEDLTNFAEKALPPLLSLLSVLIDNIGAITAGLAAYTIVVKGAAAKQALLNAKLIANPYALAAAAIAGVTVALISAVNRTDELTKALESAREEYESVKEQGEKAAADAEFQASKVEMLKNRLYELDDALSDVGEDSQEAAGKKRELLGVVEDLKEYIPDLAVEIDSETGRLITQRTEIDKLCQSYADLTIAKAKAQAAEDSLEAAYKVQFEAEKKYSETLTAYNKVKSVQNYPNANARAFWNSDNRLEAAGQYINALFGGGDNLRENAKITFEKAESDLASAKKDVEYWRSIVDNANDEVRNLESQNVNSNNGDGEDEKKECQNCHQKVPKSAVICPYCGKSFDGTNSGTGGGGTKTSDSPYTQGVKDLKYRRNMDILTEEEYYRELEGLRDEYLAEDSDEWKDVTAEIYKYRKNAAKEERETLSKEQEEAYNAQRKAAFDDLEYRHKRGLISEKEYYDELAELRDRYYAEGSDEYRDYTDKLIDYQKSAIQKAYEDIASFSDKALSQVESKMETMRQKLASYGTRMEEGEDGTYSLTDPKKSLEALLEYNCYLGEVKKRMQTLSLSDGDISGFFSVMADMSVEEGTQFAKLLSEKSDKAFTDYIHDWNQQNELAELTSRNLYQDEYQNAVDESADYIDRRFNELALDLPEDFYTAGENSADQFGKAFTSGLELLFADLTSRISGFYDSILPAGIGFLPGTVTNNSTSTTTTNNTYNYVIGSEGAKTPAEIREAIRAQNELERLGGS